MITKNMDGFGTTRKHKPRISNYFFIIYFIFQFIEGTFSISCPATFTNHKFENERVCDVTNADLICIETGQSKSISVTGLSTGSNSKKWTFYSSDASDILSITFPQFSLGGTACQNGMSSDEYASVTLSSPDKVQLPRFCSGRRPSTHAIYSAGNILSITLCNGNKYSNVVFTVKSERNWRAIAMLQPQIITISNFRNGDSNWIYIREPSGRYDVKLTLNDFHIKQSRTDKCLRAFVKIDDDSGTTLLQDDRTRSILCNTTGLKWLKPVIIQTSVEGINITHRNSKFALNFTAVAKKTATDVKQDAIDTTTMLDVQPLEGLLPSDDLDNVNDFDDGGESSAVNPTTIIAGVVSSVFVVAVIIATAFFILRRRNPKDQQDCSDKIPNNAHNVQNFEYRKKGADDVSINNFMYEAVLQGNVEDDSLHEMQPHTSQDRPLTNAGSFAYAKVKKDSKSDHLGEPSENGFIRPPQPLPRSSNHPAATPNMYETIEAATKPGSTEFNPACSAYMVSHSTPFLNSNGSGYLESSLKDLTQPYASSESLNNESANSGLLINGYNKPRPSMPNIFISSAYCSTEQLSSCDSSFNLQYKINKPEENEDTSSGLNMSNVNLHEGQFPTTYYDSPRPSLANAFQPDITSFNDNTSLS